MSSKKKATAVKEDARGVLMPKLRFPEFVGAEAWKSVPLNRLAIRVKEKNRDEKIDRVLTNSAEFGVVDQREFFDKDIATQGKLEGYFIVDLGSYVYNPRISSAAPVGPISKNKIGAGVMSPLYTVFRFKDERDEFYEHYFKTTGWHSYMRHASSTGARHDRMAISSDDFMAMPLPVSSPAEQQKIAECLSSLDELMAAQARKVDTLKTHKKGLMQQIFPRDCETQPRLRFPEFKNAGEWVVKPFGEIFHITSSKRVHESDWTSTGVPFYRAREIVALNKNDPIQPLFISEELYAAYCKQTGEIRDGHLLVTGVGSIGVPYLVRAGDRFYFKDGNIIWLKNDGKELSGDFLLRLYETDCVQNQLKVMADVGTVATYTIDNAKRTLAAFPKDKDEQQRITSCLNSLDTLITAETHKLEVLKTHKKGLMQQLFPSMEAVEA